MGHLYAYTDDSGTHDDAEVCLAAGFLGRMEDWLEFEPKWRESLLRFGLEEFHSAEFFHGKNPYSELSEDDRERLLAGLVDAITSTHLAPFGAMVNCSEFFRLSEGERRILTGGTIYRPPRSENQNRQWDDHGASTRPYQLAFRTCLTLIRDRVDGGDKISLTCDLQDRDSEKALAVFRREKGYSEQEEVGELFSCQFVSRRDAVPLQAADLLAHTWYRTTVIAQDTESDDLTWDGRYCRSEPWISTFLTIGRRGSNDLVYYAGRDDFEHALGFVPKDVRERLRS